MKKLCFIHNVPMRALFSFYACDVCDGIEPDPLTSYTSKAYIPDWLDTTRLDQCIARAREGKHCEFVALSESCATQAIRKKTQGDRVRWSGSVAAFQSGGSLTVRDYYPHERGTHKASPQHVQRGVGVVWLYYAL